MNKTFKLHVHCDADGNPVSWFQIITGSVQAISDEVFDTLVGAPSCREVEVTSDDEDDE